MPDYDDGAAEDVVIEISPDGSYDCTPEALLRRKQGGGCGLQSGQRVIIKGLKAKPELNGLTGVVKSYSANTTRYTVSVDGRNGLSVALKEQNLQNAGCSQKSKAKKQAAKKARKKEAEAKAKKEAEEKAKAKKEAEAKAKKEAEEKAKAKKEAEAKAKKEAEAKAKKEAEATAKKEAEAKAKKEAEATAKKEAEAKAKKEAEQKANAEAETKAKAAAEAKAEREEKAKAEAEEQAKKEAEAKAKKEEKAKTEAQAKAKAMREAEEKPTARKDANATDQKEASAKVEHTITCTDAAVVIAVALSSTSVTSMAQVSLEITERLLTLQLAGADAGAPPLLQLAIPDNADHAAAAAKFSKKKRKLTVTLPTLA